MSLLAEHHDDLRREWSTLEAQWQSTRGQWQDNVAVRFEKQFWHPLDDCIPQLLRSMDEVDEILSRALRSLDQ
jgi:hypothetical protein